MTDQSALGTPDPTGPRRGRPPRYSREQIVRDVAQMLIDDPTAPITIARAAEAIGAAPMSLYRHFADREDLLVSVAHHVFIGARPPVAPDTPWQEQIRMWMTTVYRQALLVPQLVQLVASGESPAWLADSAYLASVLEGAGLQGDDQRLAEAVHWVATATLGHAMLHVARPAELPVGRLDRALADLPRDDAERVSRILPHLAAMHPHDFDNVVEWTIAGLEHVLGPHPTPKRSRGRG